MRCGYVRLQGGRTAIVCGRGRRIDRCAWCTKDGTFQCDWKIGGGKTCDKHLCGKHAQEVAPEKHLCPEHQKAYEEWLAKRQQENATK